MALNETLHDPSPAGPEPGHDEQKQQTTDLAAHGI